MPPSPRVVLANLALIAASLVFALLAGELVLFRFIFLPSDVPRNAFTDGVVRHAPQQTGITRLRDEFAAPFAINAQGWNSGVGDYRLARTPGVARIAIVGDSMVEAMQVAATASLAEQLGRRLGVAAEVYRFAISGAPLSQYLWMIEREVARYAPDLVVVVLINNDFDESFRFKPGRYTSSFLKLKIADGRVTDEIPPTAYQPPWWDGLRFSATFRYLYYRQRACPEALCALFLGRNVASLFQANVDVDLVARARRHPYCHRIRICAAGSPRARRRFPAFIDDGRRSPGGLCRRRSRAALCRRRPCAQRPGGRGGGQKRDRLHRPACALRRRLAGTP